ncbi:C40 family peptidase [Streptomyces sp. NPDC001594]|uniref:C40 family peptidase n=1 Tax=Streptomyces sp. NPDC001594 TaxID=3364590 RepID=UPI0036B6228E
MPPYSQHTAARTRRAGTARHRKPSPPLPGKNALQLGIATGVLGTVMAAAPANAAEDTRPDTSTLELDLRTSETAETAAVLRDWAQRLELHDRQNRAAGDAATEARTDKQTALRDERQRFEQQKAARQKADRERAILAAGAAQEKAARDKAAGNRAPGPKKPSVGTQTPGSSLSGVAGFARSKVGSAYVWGASTGNAFDCSGLVLAAYKTIGVSVPRTSQEQSKAYPDVKGELRPGDILYWGKKGAAHHVAVYVGDGKYVGAQNPRVGVVMRDVAGSGYTGAVRPG